MDGGGGGGGSYDVSYYKQRLQRLEEKLAKEHAKVKIESRFEAAHRSEVNWSVEAAAVDEADVVTNEDMVDAGVRNGPEPFALLVVPQTPEVPRCAHTNSQSHASSLVRLVDDGE